MPNIGRPSKDCHLCRKRRVKCDLGRPGCQRCVKYGVECPGYRDQQELIFRNANPASLKKRKKTAAAAAAAKAEAEAEGSQDGNDHSSPHSTSSSSDSSSSSSGTVKKRPTKDAAVGIKPIDPTFAIAVASGIPPGVHQHWTEHSVPIVLNIYSTFDFLATMYQRHGTEGPLLWAAHLFSRTYIHNLRAPASSRMNTQQDIQNELAGYMNKALRGIGDALQTREGVMRDDILLTVWILTNYELLMGSLRRNQLHSPWFLHTRGLRSLLKARGSKPLYTPKGRAAFWPAFTVVQINAMVTNVECPPESAEWLKIIRERMYPEEEPDYHCSLFILRATQVIYRILDIFRNRDFLAASLEYNQLYQTVLDAEKDYDEYIAENPNVVEARRYMQNLQRSGSIKAHRYLNLLANFLTHYPYNQIPLEQLQMERNYSVRRVRTEAQAILDCIPVALSPASLGVEDSPRYLFNALRLCWPLQAVYVIKTTLPEQKREAERALLHMGTQMGVRQALRWRRAPRFYPEEAERPLGLVELEGSDEQSYQGMAQNEPMHPDFEDTRVIETYH